MDKAPSRKRRIIRPAALIVVAALMLLSGYISTWLCVSKAADKGQIHWTTVDRVRPAFVPILAYSQADYPGAGALRELRWQVNPMLHSNPTGHGTVFISTDALGLAPPEQRGLVIPRGFGMALGSEVAAPQIAIEGGVSVR